MNTELKSYSKEQRETLLDLAASLKKLATIGVLSIGREGQAVDGDRVCLLSPALAELLNQALADAAPSRFDEFWSVWPKCRRDAKKQALTTWKSKKLDRIADTIIADVQARINSGRWGNNPQYILLPTTYLRGERWNDASSDFYGKPENDGLRLSKAVPRSKNQTQPKPSLSRVVGG